MKLKPTLIIRDGKEIDYLESGEDDFCLLGVWIGHIEQERGPVF